MSSSTSTVERNPLNERASLNVDYPLTTSEVVTRTNAAIASGNYGTQKNQFDTYNNLGAPGFCD